MKSSCELLLAEWRIASSPQQECRRKEMRHFPHFQFCVFHIDVFPQEMYFSFFDDIQKNGKMSNIVEKHYVA